MKENQKEQKKRAPRFGQRKVQVKIKKLREDAVIPAYAHGTDAAMDLTAVWKQSDGLGNMTYGFGLAVEIPEGYVGLIFPRSSVYDKGLLLSNSVGVIDSGYRGEITAKFATRYMMVRPTYIKDKIKMLFERKKTIKKDTNYELSSTACYDSTNYNVGDRVAQLIIMPYPKVQLNVVDELSNTDRGEGGYGSTGK